jgi:phage repressor protein C with HTH and peptisase S24 domain
VARKKTSKVRVNVKASISRRLRDVRQELFGEHGGPELARRLNLPARTWYNYETGVTVPAEVLLSFIDQTNANPLWLLSGEGERFRRDADLSSLAELTPIQLIRRGLEKLEQQPIEPYRSDLLSEEAGSDFVSVALVPLDSLGDREILGGRVDGHVMAYREWLPHPRETVAVRLEDESMFPVLPAGSVVAIDRSITNPLQLQGKMVAANPGGSTMIRWLDLSGKHLIFRPNQTSRDYPLIPMELGDSTPNPILGQIVWSWSCFNSPEN